MGYLDKLNVFVVMDSEFYRNKLVLQDHLNSSTYERTNGDADVKVFKEQNDLLLKRKIVC